MDMKKWIPYILLGIGGYFLYRKVTTGVLPGLQDFGSRIGTGIFDLTHKNAYASNAPVIQPKDVPAARKLFNAAVARGINPEVAYKLLTNWTQGQPDPTLAATPQTKLSDLV